MKPRKNNEQTLKEAMQDFFNLFQLNTRLNDARVLAYWEEVMGKTIAKHTTNLYISKGILYLSIDSGPLKQELFYGRQKIQELMNERIGQDHITEVVIR